MAVVEIGDNGDLCVPAELLGAFPPHTPFEVEATPNALVLRAIDQGRAFWDRSTSEERAKAVLEWTEADRPPAPDLSDEALRRENLYD